MFKKNYKKNNSLKRKMRTELLFNFMILNNACVYITILI
jgi:hypothetical protein